MANQPLLIAKLRAMRSTAKGANSVIAAFVLDKMEDLPLWTINELAAQTNTSYATVCRFLKAVNVNGFKEFKNAVLKEAAPLHAGTDKRQGDFNAADPNDFSETSQKICNFYINAIKECGKRVTEKTIQKIAETIHAANMVLFIGLGTSAISAQYAYTKFFRIKDSCVYDQDIIIGKMKAAIMNERSVLFAVSSSGRTKSIIDIAKIAHANGASVISLGDFSNSPLSKISDISISTSVRESSKYIDTDFPMIQAQITIIDILYSGMYQYLKDAAEAGFEKTANAVRADKDKTV